MLARNLPLTASVERVPFSTLKANPKCLSINVANVAELLRNSEEKSRSQAGDELRSNSSTNDSNNILEVRYHISDFVVMPNHVHDIVCFLPGVRLLAQCRSWKHFTAVKINSALGVNGEFWQPESFDHLIRDCEHFMRFRKYIAENREKANLKSGEGIYYRCPDA